MPDFVQLNGKDLLCIGGNENFAKFVGFKDLKQAMDRRDCQFPRKAAEFPNFFEECD